MKPTFPPLTPAPGLMPPGANQASRAFQERRSSFAARDTQDAFAKTDKWLGQFREMNLTVDGKTYVVLARPSGIDDTSASGSFTPWQMVKQLNRVCRIYPSAIWDGKGNDVWASYNGEEGIAEGYFDVELPATPLHGYIWVECTVNDDDPYHGVVLSAIIKCGERPAAGFKFRSGDIVNKELAVYDIVATNEAAEGFTLDPVPAFVFILRRYGPPTSETWDAEPAA